jgi:DNA-binding transcriptional ArsR family regulator
MANGGEERPPAAPSAGLDERVLSTLQGLRGRIAFSGLRRVLGAHPESLSRALRRLEREGLVERNDGGYRALLPSHPAGPPSTELRSIARVDLPPGVEAEFVHGRLSGRWFGSLRWVGVVERPGGRLLAWAGRDGSGYVLLGIQRGVLHVYVPAEPADGDPADVEDSAYELLGHAVDALRFSASGSSGAVALFAAARDLTPRWSVEN